MKSYLVFQMYGPMAAWGEVAVGEYRPSSLQPSKSAVLGLIASALGIPRDDEATHTAMTSELGCAMYVDAAGTLLRDYHTVQPPPARKGVTYATRRDQLIARDAGGRKPNPILSTRDYWCDGRYTICLWTRRADVRFDLESIRDALQRPRYPLFLGRRSCPLSLPLDPQILPAASFHEAYRSRGRPSSNFLAKLEEPQSVSVYWDEDGIPGFQEKGQSVMRRDVHCNRLPLQFDERSELHAVVNPGAGT